MAPGVADYDDVEPAPLLCTEETAPDVRSVALLVAVLAVWPPVAFADFVLGLVVSASLFPEPLPALLVSLPALREPAGSLCPGWRLMGLCSASPLVFSCPVLFDSPSCSDFQLWWCLLVSLVAFYFLRIVPPPPVLSLLRQTLDKAGVNAWYLAFIKPLEQIVGSPAP